MPVADDVRRECLRGALVAHFALGGPSDPVSASEREGAGAFAAAVEERGGERRRELERRRERT